MNSIVEDKLRIRERRLSPQMVNAISSWLNVEHETGRSIQPADIFSRFCPQVAGAALEQRSRDLVRLVVKGHLRAAGWIHEPQREYDWERLSLPVWVCQQLGFDSRQVVLSAADEFGPEIAQLVEGRLPYVDRVLERNGGPVYGSRHVAIRLLGAGVDFEPCWDFDDHERHVDLVGWEVDNLAKAIIKVRELEGAEAAERMVSRYVRPDLQNMDWFGGQPAPAGMAIWDDSDPLAEYRVVLDQVAATGSVRSLPSQEVVEAYVREKATTTARYGSTKALREGLAVALLAADSMVMLLGHAVWYYEGEIRGCDRVDRVLRGLPGNLQTRHVRGSDLVRENDFDGVVLTGLYTGLKYSAPYRV